jgi:hypothetical protein
VWPAAYLRDRIRPISANWPSSCPVRR